MNKTVSIKSYFVTLLLIALMVDVGTWIAYGTSSGGTFTLSGGVYPGAPNFTVWTDSSYYYAKNAYGNLMFSGSNFTSLMESVLSHLPILSYSYPSMTYPKRSGSIHLVSGNYSVYQPILINNTFQTVTFSLDSRAFIKIMNNQAAFWITGAATSGIKFDGGVFFGVTGYTGYGIRVDGGSDFAIKNSFAWFTKNYWVFLNGSVNPLNYLTLQNLGAASTKGILYATGPSWGGRSMSLNILNIRVTADESSIATFWMHNVFDVSYAQIVGESNQDFFLVEGFSAGQYFVHASVTSYYANSFDFRVWNNAQPYQIFMDTCYAFNSYQGMFIDANASTITNFETSWSQTNSIFVNYRASNVYFIGGTWQGSHFPGAVNVTALPGPPPFPGYYDVYVNNTGSWGAKTNGPIRFLGAMMSSLNVTKNMYIPITNRVMVSDCNIYSPGGAWNNAPANSTGNYFGVT